MNLELLQIGNYEPAISQVKSHLRNLLCRFQGSTKECDSPCPGSLAGTYFFGFLSFFFFFSWLISMIFRISVPWLGIEPRPWQWKPGTLSARPPGNSQQETNSNEPPRWAKPGVWSNTKVCLLLHHLTHQSPPHHIRSPTAVLHTRPHIQDSKRDKLCTLRVSHDSIPSSAWGPEKALEALD